MEEKVNPPKAHLETLAVHAGDRKRTGSWVPVATPIHLATSFFYENVSDVDKVFAGEMEGPSYSRHGNPTGEALEELLTALEGGAGALACASGMAALHLAVTAALLDRRRVLLAASALYGATTNMLLKVFEPAGVEVVFADLCDESAAAAAIAEHRPGAILLETISNPLLRVAPIDRIAELARETGAQVIVDPTFSTPLITRPLEYGANFAVHSVTKYLSGHGDVLGGAVITDDANIATVRSLAKSIGPQLGPFEAYLTMRGIKTFPLRMERQCRNAAKIANWLTTHSHVSRVYFPGDPDHPDSAAVKRLFAPGLFGAMVSFEIDQGEANQTGRESVFRFMNALRTVVPATSLGDVHTMVTYPAISSHRDLSPKHRARLGIQDNLIRLSVGIENADDIIADLDSALRA